MDVDRNLAAARAESSPWPHRPVQGLPASLLAREGQTVAVVALMQREGWLSRDRRRDVVVDLRAQRSWPDGVDTSLPRTELNQLARFLDPQQRALAFWNLVAARRERRRSEALAAHIVSLEAQLLRAYEPAWDALELDDEALCRACPPWPAIRARIEEETSRLVRRPRVSPCMLWLPLCADLDRWPRLDDARRRRVAHAVFALATVCWSDWFVHEAMRRCPELQPELGGTCAEFGGDAVPGAAAAPVPPVAKVPLGLIVERLAALGAELAERPSREAVAELEACAREARAWGLALPDRAMVARRALGLAVEGLRGQTDALAGTPALGWLTVDVRDQVQARWALAARGLDAPGLRQLAEDATQAGVRIDAAAGRCVAAALALEATRAALCSAEDAIDAAPTLARRREAERAFAEALRQRLEAESAVPALEDALLAACSPWGEAYDLGADYLAQLARAEAGAPESCSETPAQVPPEVASSGFVGPSGAVAVSGGLVELLTG